MTKNKLLWSSFCFLAIGSLFLENRNPVQAQEAKPTTEALWQPLSIPDTNDVLKLEQFLDETKKRQPVKPEQYLEMQRALRTVAMRIVETVTDHKSPIFRKAEAEFVSASVMLLGNEGPDAQRKTFERFQDYLTKREKIVAWKGARAIVAGCPK